MIRFSLVVTLIFSWSVVALAQEKFTLNGYVKDAQNGEELIGVTFIFQPLRRELQPMPMVFMRSRFRKAVMRFNTATSGIPRKPTPST
jgi:hypothetical protein